jgi:hypothetical protein
MLTFEGKVEAAHIDEDVVIADEDSLRHKHRYWVEPVVQRVVLHTQDLEAACLG